MPDYYIGKLLYSSNFPFQSSNFSLDISSNFCAHVIGHLTFFLGHSSDHSSATQGSSPMELSHISPHPRCSWNKCPCCSSTTPRCNCSVLPETWESSLLTHLPLHLYCQQAPLFPPDMYLVYLP